MNVHETEFVLGDEAKALGDGRFEGRLVTFGSEHTPDKSAKRDWFDAKTDFGFEPGETITSPVFFHHGLDRKVGGKRFGRGTLEHRDDGIYIKGTISLRDDESRRLYSEIEAGKHKLSSGVPSYLVDRKAVGDTHYVGRWVLGSDASVTPSPADDRTYISSIKSLMEEHSEHDDEAEAVPATLIADLRALATKAAEMTARTAKAKADRGTRGLASAYRDAVEDIADALKAVTDDWTSLAEPPAAVPPPEVEQVAPTPDPDALAAEAAAQFAQFQAHLARSNGVAI